eukprot:Gb_30692 [translate_table: standard]
MCLKDGEPIKGSAVTMMNNSCPCKEAEEGKAVSEMVAGTDKHGGDMHKDNEKPPNPLGSAIRQSVNNGRLASPCPVSLVRHNSLMKSTAEAVGAIKNKESVDFMPILRSGYWSDIGGRLYMEDAHVCITDLAKTFGCASFGESPVAFYGVFDGHGGKAAAHFVRDNLPRLIVESADFPLELEKAVRWSFLETDNAFAEACLLHTGLSSGTTALTAMISGRTLLVANAGDCRAVLSRRGRAVEMSKDHKPCCKRERKRIEGSGGYVDDGYLNGQLNVTRALGDWHIEGMKEIGVGGGPLSAEPELKRTTLTKEDEFLIIGCDGLWDVFTSQNAVDFARRKLQEHNDLEACCKELIDEAIKRKTADNLTVVVVCFQSEPPPNLVVNRPQVQRSISAEGLRSLQGFLDSLRE